MTFMQCANVQTEAEMGTLKSCTTAVYRFEKFLICQQKAEVVVV